VALSKSLRGVTRFDRLLQHAPCAVAWPNPGQPRLARVVDYRFFGGLSNEEIGVVLGLTERTVERDWIKARMLLREMLSA